MKKLLLLLALAFCLIAKAQIITTVVGHYIGDGGQSTNAFLFAPYTVTFDASGNMYIADGLNHRIRKVNTAGIISTVAGNGTAGYSGDGGPATVAELNNPTGITFDAFGNMYVADNQNFRIRKINTAGIISTVVSSGYGYSGNGGPATAAKLSQPHGIAFDLSGNLYIADTYNACIRKVNTAGIISTIAGNDTSGYKGDGGLATAAELSEPVGIAFDAAGNLYIADAFRIRKVNTAGIINTVVGNGSQGYSGDGGLATAAQLNYPGGIAFDVSGNMYITDGFNACVRMINTAGIINTVAGNGIQGYTGDGGIATAAEIGNLFSGLSFDVSGNLYVADGINNVIRKISTNNIITTAVGSIGNGVTQPSLELYGPAGLTFDKAGNMYITEISCPRVRKVTTAGIISIIAGNGIVGFSGDGGAATAAKIQNTRGVVVDNFGNIYIADNGNNVVRKINPLGIITTIAGNSNSFQGFSGDGGPATAAELAGPTGIAFDALGNLYISDGFNNRIRKVNTAGIITTIAGTGNAGYSGDGGLALAAELNFPWGITLDALGNIYIPDFSNNCIRKINTAGLITTVAGNGIVGYTGDGGLATAAQLNHPTAVTIDTLGNLYIADGENNCVRKVNTAGIINTIVGNNIQGYSGDGGLSTAAELNLPWGMVFDTNGNLYIVDSQNLCVRKVTNAEQASIETFNTQHSSFQIYPNPNNGSFIIETNLTSKQTLQVYDVNGKFVLSQTINGKNSIDISNINAGVYNISLLSSDGAVNKKLVIVK